VVADAIAANTDIRVAAARGDTVALLDMPVRITGARVDGGRSDRLDVLRVTALRDQQAALVPQILADRRAALLRLAMVRR
jgi:multidrug efflux system outer membrane protein